jgi:glycosyltransferase involved in cell wall biosynthesis
VRVLYLHMTGAFGGSSRSLVEVIRAFPPGAAEAKFVAPRGSASRFFCELGDVIEARDLSRFDNTRYSYYRGFRWLVLARELALVPTTIMALRQAKRRWGAIDLIHVNEFTGLLPWWLARRGFRAPVVVHVRSVARNDCGSLRTRLVNWMLRNKAEAIIAIDETVRASLPADLHIDVIHNVFSPMPPIEQDEALDRELALRARSFKVGFVGNLLRVKGIHELIEAARITRDQGLDIEFVIVGDDAHPSHGLKARFLKILGLGQNMRAEVEVAIDAHGLRDRIHLIGFTADISRIYRRMDVLCFPSHFDAPGRPIFEAAFLKVPSIVAVNDPKPDTLIDGISGIAIAPRDASQLAAAIARLANNRPLAKKMGEAAHTLATENFSVMRNSEALLQVYRRVLARRG